jgi:hypothetical protein
MPFAKHFPATTWIWRIATGRIARYTFLIFFFAVIGVAIVPRLNSYLLARKFQVVLFGLSTLKIDETTEEELLQRVPYLQLSPNSSSFGLDHEHWYYASFTNESAWARLGQLTMYRPGQAFSREWIRKWADWLGFRYMALGASVIVFDGKVSSIRYGVASEFVAPRSFGDIVSVRSVHGYWMEHRMPPWVTSADDQSPRYRVKETAHRPAGDESIESSLEVSYAFDAPPEMTVHSFQIDLHCFWSARGCRNGREILPLAWQDKNSIEAAALARLQSDHPCPDSVLEGRMRYLPDVDAFLVEVTNSMVENMSAAREFDSNQATYYRVLKRLRGESRTPSGIFLDRTTIPSPGDPRQEIPNPTEARDKAGDRLIIFSSHHFDSCSVLVATPSAESIIRATEPAPRRREDQILSGKLL